MRDMNQKGTSLFEFALVLPALMLLTLGAVDINRVLHERQALQEAAKSAARCLYATDGDCLQHSAPPAPNLSWFQQDWQPTFLFPLKNYSASVSWGSHTVNTVQAQINTVQSGSYSLLSRSYDATVQLQGDWKIKKLYWLRRGGFPSITPGSNAGGNPVQDDNPRLASAQSGQGHHISIDVTNVPAVMPSQPPHFSTLAIHHSSAWSGGTTASDSNPAQLGYVDFKIPDPYRRADSMGLVPAGFSATFPIAGSAPIPEIDCFAKTNSTNDHKGPKCNSGWPSGFDASAASEVTTHTYVLLRVTGDAHNADGDQGRVVISLQENPLGSASTKGTPISLGGQVYAGSGAADFWFRGAPDSNTPHFPGYKVKIGTDTHGTPIYSDFHAPIKVKYNTRYRLLFHISDPDPSTSLPVRYTVDNVDIWYPRYDLREAEIDCVGLVTAQGVAATEGQCSSPQLNRFNPAIPSTGLSSYQSVPYTISNLCVPYGQTAKNVAATQISGAPDNNPNHYTFTKVAGAPACGQSGPHPIACPAVAQAPSTNNGISSNPSFAEIFAACPFSDPGVSAPASVCDPADPNNDCNANYITQVIDVPAYAPIAWGLICQNPYPPTPAGYNQVTWNLLSSITSYYSTDPLAPVPPVCTQFTQYDLDRNQPHVPNTSLFHSSTPDLGCNWQQSLKNEAQAILNAPGVLPANLSSVPAEAYYQYFQNSAGFVTVAQGSTSCSIPGTGAKSCISDSCVQLVNGTPVYSGVAALGCYPSGVVPAQCQGSSASSICFSQHTGCGNAPTSGYTPNVNVQAAIDRAYAKFQASVPSALLGCNGPRCTQFVPAIDLNNKKVSIDAEYEVPLLLLGNRSVKLKSRVIEAMEEQFAH